MATSSIGTVNFQRQRLCRLTRQDSLRHRPWFLAQNLKTTADLIGAYNAASDAQVKGVYRAVVEEYLEWFSRMQAENLRVAEISEYTMLGGLAAEDEITKDLLNRWFRIFCRKLTKTRFGEQSLLAGLEVILLSTDGRVFEVEPNSLLALATALLEKINIGETALTAELYPSHQLTLSTLYQTLVVFEKAAPGQLDPSAPNGLYRSFKQKLEEIIKHQLYYPIRYQATLIQQCLGRMTHRSAPSSDRLRCFFSGFVGSLKIVRGIRALVSADFDFQLFMEGYQSLKSAFEGRRIQAKDWYTWIQALNHAVLETIRDQSAFKQFEDCFEILRLKEQATAIGNDRTALRFGMLDQLLILAADGPTSQIRKEAAGKLYTIGESCMHQGSWADDKAIFEAVLDSVYAVHLSGIDRDGSANALELMKMNQSTQAQEIFLKWLGTESFEDKINKIPAAEEEDTSGCLLEMVKERMGWTESHASIDKHREHLKTFYRSDAFALMESFFEADSAKHVSNLHHQLMLLQELNENESNDSRPAPTSREPIDIKNLFDDRRKGPGQPIESIDRALLVGNPGTGKTSVSRKIAYLWATDEWGDAFQAVYVIPVRNLSRSEYDQTSTRRQRTLATAIANNCFDPVSDDNKYEELRYLIEAELSRPTTLVILDGLDERMSACPRIVNAIISRQSSAAHKLLCTGRPDGLMSDANFADIKVECVGMNEDQVVSYIQSEFPTGEEGSGLPTCLKQHDVSWYLAKIPVNLLIFCFLWKSPNDRISLQKGNEAGSLLLLYRRITDFMWKRFSDRCPIENADRDAAFDAIGEVAFKALSVGDLYLRQTILEECISSRSMMRLVKHSGFFFLRPSGNEYVFPHLTFQEYFAGRYLARVLCERITGRSIDTHRAFVSTKKYHGPFLNLLTFTAEAVADLDGFEGLEMLYKLIDRDPVELVSVQHLFIKVRLFNAYLAIHGKPADSELESTATQCAIKSLKHLIEKSTPPSLKRGSMDNQKTWLGSVIGYIGRNVTSSGFSSFFDFFFGIRFIFNEELKRLPHILRQYPDVLTQETEENNLDAVVDMFVRWSSHKNSTLRLAAMGQASRILQLVPGRSDDIVEGFLRGCNDEVEDVRLVSMYYLTVVLRLCPESMKPALLRQLSWTCKSDLKAKVRKKARCQIQRALEIVPAHTLLLRDVLSLATEDDGRGTFGFHFFEKFTVERLLDSYWQHKDDKKIKALICKLFNVSLTVQAGSSNESLKLVLHTPTEQTFEWERPKREIKRFVDRVDSFMHIELTFLPERLRHTNQGVLGYLKTSLHATFAEFLVSNAPSI